jgi:hypothetical protein
VALLTYFIVPYIPVAMLTMIAAVALAVGIWWHWTQFAVDYRTSTWQEQLRNYASYVMVLIVILLSYAFYVFAWSGSSIQEYAAQAGTAIRNAGRSVTSQTARALTAASNTVFSPPSVAAGNVGTPGGRNARAATNANAGIANFLE